MPYLTPTAIENRVTSLALAHSTVCAQVALPNLTHEGATVHYLKIAKGAGASRPKVLITAGIHAREWAPPDAVLAFTTKLLEAYKRKDPIKFRAFTDTKPASPITYPAWTLPARDVKQIVERLTLYIVPCVNPDGRAWSMNTAGDRMWRKNRRPDPATGCIGVDINRNFNIAWDFEKYYNNTVLTDPLSHLAASKDPCDNQVYIGPSAASEPETRNIESLVSSEGIKYFVDVHAYGRKIMYPWGLDKNQTIDPNQSFQNPSFDRNVAGVGGRDGSLGNAYAEYFPDAAPHRLLKKHQLLATRMKASILKGAGADARAKSRSKYSVEPSLGIGYMATGVSDDFVFSRQILNSSLSPIFAFTIECGSSSHGEGGFHPDNANIYPKIEREVHAALSGLLTNLAAWVSPTASP